MDARTATLGEVEHFCGFEKRHELSRSDLNPFLSVRNHRRASTKPLDVRRRNTSNTKILIQFGDTVKIPIGMRNDLIVQTIQISEDMEAEIQAVFS